MFCVQMSITLLTNVLSIAVLYVEKKDTDRINCLVKEDLCSFRNLFRSVLWASLSNERLFLKILVNCE
jgi:hypothetical protein